MIRDSNLRVTQAELNLHHISLEKIQESLTLPNPEYANIVRFGKGKFYRKVSPTICYLYKNGDYFLLPRNYSMEGVSFPDAIDKTILGNSLSGSFSSKFSLRDYQEKFMATVGSETDILLEAGCGTGKTVVALFLSFNFNRKTFIVVPTYELAKQWRERIMEFTTSSCYIMSSRDKRIPIDWDFVIASLDLCTVRDFPDSFVQSVGTVILDEAHRVGADTYIPLLDRFPSKYRIALTATFRRNDGVHKILAYHFGKHYKMESNFPKPSFYSINTGVTVKALLSKNKPWEKFLEYLEDNHIPHKETKSVLAFDGISVEKVIGLDLTLSATARRELIRRNSNAMDFSYVTMDSFLNEHSGRRKLVITLLKKCLEADRTVLFLSKRKDILKTLYKYPAFQKYDPVLVISESSKRTEEETEILRKKSKLILGVTQLAKEGLDIDRLDTLIIHLPMKDTEQAVGRISRLCDGKKDPVAFYLLDNCPFAYAVFNSAGKYIAINAEFKGTRVLDTISPIL